MICRYCGKEIADDSVFCEFCGRRVHKKSFLKPLWITLGVLVGIFLVSFLTYVIIDEPVCSSEYNDNEEVIPEDTSIAEAETSNPIEVSKSTTVKQENNSTIDSQSKKIVKQETATLMNGYVDLGFFLIGNQSYYYFPVLL